MLFDTPDLFILANNVVLLFIALSTALTTFLTIKIKKLSTETRDMSAKTELNTNSMKDALVASTAKASHQEGREEMRREQENK